MSTVEAPHRAKADRPPEAPAAAAAQPLYASRQKVYPKRVFGVVRSVKWAVLALCLALYYVVPWIRWNRGPGLPDQAVLVDIENARLFFFWIEIWPQEIYFLTGALILGAFALFAVSSLFGRLWCGFTCPQTVWTDLFMFVERWIQGDRNARMKLDQGPRNANYWTRKGLTHFVWLLIAAATGGAWVMYFVDAPTVTMQILTGHASVQVYFFFALFAGFTYLLAGWAREQVCTYMCPWPRFQAAMLDENSLVVTYRDWRGEPRGKAKAEGVGDCVDCFACVHVCPTGIDIRDGQQLECIGCGLCVDACDSVMGKLGRPKGLIAFETLKNLAASEAATVGMPPGEARYKAGMAARHLPRFIRPRTMMYAGAIAVVSLVMLGAFLLRSTLDVTVLRDRAPLFVRLSDGGIRNGYTIKIVNKRREDSPLVLDLQAPQGFRMVVQDADTDPDGRPMVARRADGIVQYRVLVSVPPGQRLPESTPVTFRLLEPSGRVAARQSSTFVGPRQ
ncbi:cytochrome c oxidase accessory protein CcoG [Neoroseomonas oryzicola]|uniref:Cytochrome c oxidase accessory protein CcoG n=1 Tax=Neoroseomonas oryzicola TaxID=535904 RepID=A0A9X9WN89_9PROT|nr:cytochrome c oxidase accessory protein CcoG [Neoroseomonas oryzicola]MBR0661799.1 cytochrome c oxidase accessory protein CcoG [Neoroseomonas oryzicola]NKE17093.1 cytochrome c oxidase accessory protein CcoG [Neoroseomonas oryzicola]